MPSSELCIDITLPTGWNRLSEEERVIALRAAELELERCTRLVLRLRGVGA